jgi:hypothetical protein
MSINTKQHAAEFFTTLFYSFMFYLTMVLLAQHYTVSSDAKLPYLI